MTFEDQETGLLRCSQCGQLTDSLKEYHYLRWCVFLLAGAIYQTATVRACPECMRAFLRKSLLINVLPANLLWLVLLLPWGLILLAMSHRGGHSKVALRGVELETELAQTQTATVSPFAAREVITVEGQEVSWPRVMVLVALITCWVPLLGLLFASLAFFLNHRKPGWQRNCALISFALAGLCTFAPVVVIVFDALLRG
jgi:hypothetical protein